MTGIYFLDQNGICFADYALKLDTDSKDRYREKIAVISGTDAFLLPANAWSEDVLPATEFPDLFTYFILETSSYTAAQFKAYKSLTAYNLFVSGWVTSVRAMLLGELT